MPEGYDPDLFSPHAGNLDAYYDLMKALHQDPDISRRYFIEFFSYDWRLSNSVSAQKLDDFIDEGGYDQVVLISHSMGGLVSSGYMSLGANQREKVKEAYMLASPLVGAPEVINVWANLNFSALGTSFSPWIIPFVNAILSNVTDMPDAIEALIGSYRSVYELFPTERYLDTGAPHFFYHEIDLGFGITENSACSYERSKELYPEFLDCYNPNLMDAAEAFHENCYVNQRHVTELVDCTYLYGTGAETTHQLTYSEEIVWIFWSSLEDLDITESPYSGDGLVPAFSATAGRTGDCCVPHSGAQHMSFILEGTDPFNDLMERLNGG